jgi:transmembrane sensor
MSNDELSGLVEKYLEGRMTSQERRRLQVLGQSEENREILAEIIAAVLAGDRYKESSGVDRNQVFEYVLREAEQRIQMSPDAGPFPNSEHSPGTAPLLNIRPFWKGAAVAAAVVLLVVCTAGLVWRRAHRPLAAAKDRPGFRMQTGTGVESKAILMLADGSTIELDSSRNGVLRNLGKVQVVKLTGGRLEYRNLSPQKAHSTQEPIVSAQAPALSSPQYNYNTIVTPKGGIFQLTLPDGSTVWLNSESSLRFPTSFSSDSRRVYLSGEGYFSVAKNEKAPFIVQVDKMEVDVLGTNFDVMAYKEENTIRTTLVEGAVKVRSGTESAVIQPDQEASLSPDGKHFRIAVADLEESLAWKEGKFRFRNTAIAAIMRQIARWYDVEISYEGDLSCIELSGGMERKEDVSQILELLEQTGRVHFNKQGNRITVLPARGGK